jgi:hypothetical protein
MEVMTFGIPWWQRFDSSAVTRSTSQLSAHQLHRGGVFDLPLVALANAWRIAICFARSKLLSKVNLHARIASGTDNPGHRNMKAMVCAMHSSTRRPLPDMLRKIFGQWEQTFGL